MLSSNTFSSQQLRTYSTLRPRRTPSATNSIKQYSQPAKEIDAKPKSVAAIDSKLTHLDEAGAAHMVDISSKKETTRLATAVATLLFSRHETYAALSSQTIAKGDAIAVARIAAIQAAKKTSDLIPLAHPSLNITGIDIDIASFSGGEQNSTYSTFRQGQHVSTLESGNGGVTVSATVKCQGKTGVEMEAITAATMGAVTLYDMLKAIDKGMVIMGARVVEKQGGKSGDWVWDEGTNHLVRPERIEGEPPSHEQVFETPMQESRLSEVEQWNEGLAAEFSIMGEVERLEAERKS